MHTSDRPELERFQTMQNHYALAYRKEEREMLSLCEKEGIGVIPWSPLAHGYLTRPHEEMDATERGETHDPLSLSPTERAVASRSTNSWISEIATDRDVDVMVDSDNINGTTTVDPMLAPLHAV